MTKNNENIAINQENQQNFTFFQEILQKIFHILILIFPILYISFDKWKILQFLIPASILLVAIDYFRRKNEIIKKIANKIFDKILRQKEQESLSGLSFTLIAICIIFLFFKKEIAIISIAILAICDLCAAIFIKSIKSAPFFEKTIASFLAFTISGFFVVIFFGIYFHLSFFYYFFAVLSLVASAIIEARPSLFKIDDNLSIPLSFAAILTFFDLIWRVI